MNEITEQITVEGIISTIYAKLFLPFGCWWIDPFDVATADIAKLHNLIIIPPFRPQKANGWIVWSKCFIPRSVGQIHTPPFQHYSQNAFVKIHPKIIRDTKLNPLSSSQQIISALPIAYVVAAFSEVGFHDGKAWQNNRGQVRRNDENVPVALGGLHIFPTSSLIILQRKRSVKLF